jgi:hypothetical protein
MRRLGYFVLFLALISLACSSSTNLNSPAGEVAGPPFTTNNYAGLNEKAFGSYLSSFIVEFQGSYSWRYEMTTRYDGSLIEYSLHIEGVDKKMNPGDIRMVTNGRTNWMTGPGADNQCFMFPSSLDLGPTFLTPDDLLSVQPGSELMEDSGEEQILGMTADHHSLQADQLDSWKNLNLEMWLADSDAVLRYQLQAAGPDPLFDAGDGLVNALYEVVDTGPQQIERVTGCETDLPIPDNVSNLVRFPNLISFESPTSASDLADYYLDAMDALRWVLKEEPLIFDNGSILLTYKRLDNTIIISIDPRDNGSFVEIIEQYE